MRRSKARSLSIVSCSLDSTVSRDASAAQSAGTARDRYKEVVDRSTGRSPCATAIAAPQVRTRGATGYRCRSSPRLPFLSSQR